MTSWTSPFQQQPRQQNGGVIEGPPPEWNPGGGGIAGPLPSGTPGSNYLAGAGTRFEGPPPGWNPGGSLPVREGPPPEWSAKMNPAMSVLSGTSPSFTRSSIAKRAPVRRPPISKPSVSRPGVLTKPPIMKNNPMMELAGNKFLSTPFSGGGGSPVIEGPPPGWNPGGTPAPVIEGPPSDWSPSGTWSPQNQAFMQVGGNNGTLGNFAGANGPAGQQFPGGALGYWGG